MFLMSSEQFLTLKWSIPFLLQQKALLYTIVEQRKTITEQTEKINALEKRLAMLEDRWSSEKSTECEKVTNTLNI